MMFAKRRFEWPGTLSAVKIDLLTEETIGRVSATSESCQGQSRRFIASPTLPIVGGEDRQGLKITQEACPSLDCVKELRVIAGSTHLFDGPGAIEEVESLIFAWLERHLQPEMVAT
jgi:hypothetical protein